MQGRQGKRAEMNRLPAVAGDHPRPEPKPASHGVPYQVTLSGIVEQIFGEHVEMLAEDLLFMLPEFSGAPGEQERHVVEWGGVKLLITTVHDPGTEQMDVRVGMHITPEQTGFLGWDDLPGQEEEPGGEEEMS